MGDDIATTLRALWPADDSSGPNDLSDSSAKEPDGGELILAADHPAHPWVTDFRNRHNADAAKLAKIIGNGATPDEVLAISGAEFKYGQDDKAKVHGNYFGLHSPGTDAAHYYPGQTGYLPTKGGPPLATFDPANGFFYSGLRFANRTKANAASSDLPDPAGFFGLAHSLGWGTTNDNYFPLVRGAYSNLRRSAPLTDKKS